MNKLPIDLGYQDRVSEVYEDFIYEYEGRGLQWAWMIRKEFFHVPPEKQQLPFVVSLPLLTYTRINLSLSEEEINAQIVELKKKYETLPEFQGRELPTRPTIRDYLDQFFTVYGDDEIEFTIKYYHHTLVKVQGLIKDIRFNIQDIVANPKVRITPGEMVSVVIRLVNKGEQRELEEYKAFINEPEVFVQEKLTAEVIAQKFKYLSPAKLQERKELFGYDKNTPQEEVVWDVAKLQLGEVVGLEEVLNAAAQEKFSNVEVLKQATDAYRLINLQKMVEWLTRPYAGGTEKDYR